MTTHVVLLRAVNVGGAKLPMAELRDLATELGATDVSTFIASGNLICDPPKDVKAFGTDLEKAMSKGLDAALLLIPRLGFLPPGDPRVAGTVDAIQHELIQEGLILRYRSGPGDTDGMSGGEGTFLACSFWLADALTLLGRERQARQLFERLLALRNDVGLLSEEYDVVHHRQVGNFPQAYSHVSIINTASRPRRGAGRPDPASATSPGTVVTSGGRSREDRSVMSGGDTTAGAGGCIASRGPATSL